MYKCVLISGLSGSGKTTIGQLFCAKHPEWKFIDGDSFFLAVKPKVKLSNGDLVSNWDDPDSIDWNRMNSFVSTELQLTNVLLVTFMPLISRFTFPIEKHISLSMSVNELEMCIQARRVSKKKTDPVAIKRDELMVREYVYPFYKDQLVSNDAILVVQPDSMIRRSKEDILAELETRF